MGALNDILNNGVNIKTNGFNDLLFFTIIIFVTLG